VRSVVAAEDASGKPLHLVLTGLGVGPLGGDVVAVLLLRSDVGQQLVGVSLELLA
jgi:hypothetical protein